MAMNSVAEAVLLWRIWRIWGTRFQSLIVLARGSKALLQTGYSRQASTVRDGDCKKVTANIAMKNWQSIGLQLERNKMVLASTLTSKAIFAGIRYGLPVYIPCMAPRYEVISDKYTAMQALV